MDGGEKRKIAVDRRGGKEYATRMPREMQYELLFLFGSSTLKLRGRCAQRLRDILIGCKALEVLGIQHGQHVQGYVQRSFGIVDEMAHNHIVLAKRAIACNQPENFIGEAGHGGECFDFLIRQARGLQHGALDDLVGVADERAAPTRSAQHTSNSTHVATPYALLCLEKHGEPQRPEERK